MTKDEYFDHALSAFAVFTRVEKLAALKAFATLKCPGIEDRFCEAVYRIVKAAVLEGDSRTA